MACACVTGGKECDGCGACDPKFVQTCAECGGGIRNGERYWLVEEAVYCLDCINGAANVAEMEDA